MNTQFFAQLVKNQCGLIVKEKDFDSLEEAITTRMSQLGISSRLQFEELLQRNCKEIDKLAYLLTYDAASKLESECARYAKRNRQLFDSLIDPQT